MLVKACLNGGRSRSEHPALPVTPEELAREAARAVAAGAGALHAHPRGADERETLEPDACAAALEAIRAACPGVPVGLSTGEWIAGADGRLDAIAGWRVAPDFVSVNVYEQRVPELCSLLLSRGIALEAGLASVDDVGRMVALDVEWLRVLVEVENGSDEEAVREASAIDAALDSAGVRAARLHHGEGRATWAVLAAAIRAGRDIRIGIEDTLVLPDGRVARDNAELIAAAVALAAQKRRG